MMSANMVWVTTVMTVAGYVAARIVPVAWAAGYVALCAAAMAVLLVWRTMHARAVFSSAAQRAVGVAAAICALATGVLLADAVWAFALGGLFCLQYAYHMRQYY